MRLRRFFPKAKALFVLLTMITFLATGAPPLSGQGRNQVQESEPNNESGNADRFTVGDAIVGTASGLDPGPRALPSLSALVFGGSDFQVDIFTTRIRQLTPLTFSLGFAHGAWDISDTDLFRGAGFTTPPFANIPPASVAFLVVFIDSLVLALVGLPFPTNVCEYVSEMSFLLFGPAFVTSGPPLDPRIFASPCFTDLDFTVLQIPIGGALLIRDSPLAGPAGSLLLQASVLGFPPNNPENDFFGSGTPERTPSGDILQLGFDRANGLDFTQTPFNGTVFVGVSDQNQGWVDSGFASLVTELASEVIFFLVTGIFPDIPPPNFSLDDTTGSQYTLITDAATRGGPEDITPGTGFPGFINGGVSFRQIGGSPLLTRLTRNAGVPIRQAYSMSLDRATAVKLNVGVSIGQVDSIYVVDTRTRQLVARSSERIADQVISTGLLNLGAGQYEVGIASRDRKTVYMMTAANANDQIMAVTGHVIDAQERQQVLDQAAIHRQARIQEVLANLKPYEIRDAKRRIEEAGINIEATLDQALGLGADPQLVATVRQRLTALGLLGNSTGGRGGS
jgi:hypothetical protein